MAALVHNAADLSDSLLIKVVPLLLRIWQGGGTAHRRVTRHPKQECLLQQHGLAPGRQGTARPQACMPASTGSSV